MYIAEISPASHRGELVTWSSIAATLGFMLGIATELLFYKMDTGMRWRATVSLGGIIPVFVIMASLCVIIESPRFKVLVGRNEAARRILFKIYPKGRWHGFPILCIGQTNRSNMPLTQQHPHTFIRIQCQGCLERHERGLAAGTNC